LTSPLNLAIYEDLTGVESKSRETAALTLEEARESLSLLGRGLSEKYLQAKPLDEAPTFLANPSRPFPFSNGRELYLPSRMDVFDSREDNRRVYRLYAAIQAEQWEAGTFDRPRAEDVNSARGRKAWTDPGEPLDWILYFLGNFPVPVAAGDIFIVLETARAAAAARRRFRGLASDLGWFLPRLGTPIEPIDYRCVLWNLFFDLLAPPGQTGRGGYGRGIMGIASKVILKGSLLQDSLRATLAIYRQMESMLIGPAELLSSPDGYGTRAEKVAGSGDQPGDESQGLIPPELAEALTLNYYSYLIPAGSGKFLAGDNLGKRMDMEGVGDAPPGARRAPEKGAENQVETAGREEKKITYPEWNYLTGGYRRGWVDLYQMPARSGDAGAAQRLLREWEDLVREILKQFRMLRHRERTWRKRLEWGDEIDIQEAVEREIELRCGLPPTEKVYMEKRRVTREVSALFLMDLSASTSSEIQEGSHRGETVLQVLTASVVIMARALEQLGDRYGIFGFSGYGRKKVEFLHIKSFDESLTEAVWQRMGGLKPMKSTRMGAAVRHAHRLLDREPSPLKLMLLLSDGYPQDFDYGEDRTDREYGLRDTAKSLREAEADHIIPFCLTVDAAGHDYLRRMCPPQGYLVLKSVEELPSQLPKVYLRLRGT
jgi:nitric oxide reductase NorD protein